MQTGVFVPGSLQRNHFMPAPECHLFLGELTLCFVGSVWVVSHSLHHKGPGSRGIVDGLRLSCVVCVLGKRDIEQNYCSAGDL